MSNYKSEIVNTLKKILGFYEEQPLEEAIHAEPEEVIESTPEEKVEEIFNEEVVEQFNKVYSENEIKISQMEVGGKVELIDGSTGELSDAPDGDYELENGSKFTVKSGQIASIEGEAAPEESMEDEEEVPVEEPADEPIEEPVGDIQALWDKIGELEQTIANMNKAAEEMNQNFNQQFTDFTTQMEQQYNERFQAIAKIPAEFSKTNNNVLVKESKEEKLLEWAKILGKK